jgi:ABC-type antimicrobial peptide transport system permease subunit
VGAPVAVVSEIVARQYWPQQDAVGRSLHTKGRAFTVVGVVRDARYVALGQDEPRGTIYWPIAATPRPSVSNVLIRLQPSAPVDLEHLVSFVKSRCPACKWSGGHTFRPSETMTSAIDASIREQRLNAWLFSSFGLATLILVGTGILGVIAMTTSRRTREIGVRLALGSTRLRVVSLIAREQVASVCGGLIAGSVTAAWAVGFLDAYLYKLDVYDPPTWFAAMGALLAVVLASGLAPAVRASRIDPAEALRAE